MKAAFLVLLTLSPALVFAQDAKIDKVDKSPVQANFAPGGRLHMELCSSGVEVKGVDQNFVRVSYDSERDRTSNVRVRLETAGNRADLTVTGCPHNNFQLMIEVPKSSDLYVRMFAGQLEVRGVIGNKDVQLHAGQLTMDVGPSADYAHVDGSVNSGEINAPAFDVSKGGLFRSFQRSGPGKYRLHAHVGAGQLDLL